MTVLTITPVQRDALLDACDDNTDLADDGNEASIFHAPTIRLLIDGLLLPNSDGSYRVDNVPRCRLVEFLEHDLMVSLDCLEERFLRRWHASVQLLDQLGHEVDGNIYAGIVCDCGACEASRAQMAAWEA